MMNIDHKLYHEDEDHKVYHEARYDFYTNIGQLDLSRTFVVVLLPQNEAPALFCTRRCNVYAYILA